MQFASGYVTMSERIRNIRKELGWSRETLADVLGVKLHVVEGWEEGRDPSWFDLRLLAVSIGMSLDVLVSGVAPTSVSPGDPVREVLVTKAPPPAQRGAKRTRCVGSGSAPAVNGGCPVCGRSISKGVTGLVAVHAVPDRLSGDEQDRL